MAWLGNPDTSEAILHGCCQHAQGYFSLTCTGLSDTFGQPDKNVALHVPTRFCMALTEKL